MWARQTNWDWEGVGKYHWFEAEAKAESSMYASLCKANVRLYGYQVEHTERKQPRHADRCKRCVAALTRREG